MTWIKTYSPLDADEETTRLMEETRREYPPEYAVPVFPDLPLNGNIMASHSLIPRAMHHSFAAFAAMMDPELPLARRDHEMIATMVSVTNSCFY